MSSFFEFLATFKNSEDLPKFMQTLGRVYVRFYNKKYDEDFKDVIGQDMAKYAALICAAGNHNFLMEGSPGCGKSMIAKRLQYILAPMNLEEILEKAKLQALDLRL